MKESSQNKYSAGDKILMYALLESKIFEQSDLMGKCELIKDTLESIEKKNVLKYPFNIDLNNN